MACRREGIAGRPSTTDEGALYVYLFSCIARGEKIGTSTSGGIAGSRGCLQPK